MDPKVDAYITKSNARKWERELQELRRIILDCGLTEVMKWRIPVYMADKGNVLAITGLKECCTLSFFKGALLKDPKNILQKPGENTQSARVIRFTEVDQICKLEPTLKKYIKEAAEAERAGQRVEFKEVTEFEVPPELQKRLDSDAKFRTAFEALTPGRQRGYLLHFSGGKQSSTREARIDKCIPMILEGKGIHDDYMAKK